MSARPTHASRTRYSVVTELVIPSELHRLPVDPALVARCGFDPNTPQDTLLLTQVVLTGSRYSGDWKVNAFVSKGDGDVAVGEIWCMPETSRDDVLAVTEEWIRASEHVTFVPGDMYEIPMPEDQAPYFVYGMILVRGDRI